MRSLLYDLVSGIYKQIETILGGGKKSRVVLSTIIMENETESMGEIICYSIVYFVLKEKMLSVRICGNESDLTMKSEVG